MLFRSGPLDVVGAGIDDAVAVGPLDLEEVGRTIEAAQPDVVVIEELGRGWAVSGMTDEAEWLRHRLAMPYGWASANDNQFGNIVLRANAVIIGLMLWFNLVMQWLLLTTAWIATGTRSDRG